MLKLYIVLLGGRAQGCNIEVHDIVFVVGNTIEDTYPQLIKKWFGIKERLHIDAFIELIVVDKYEILLKQEKPTNTGLGLYFVNVGGYKNGYFGEIHEIKFYVATSKEEAFLKAKQELLSSIKGLHCDDAIFIENITNEKEQVVDDLTEIDCIDDYYIHLTPAKSFVPINYQLEYRKLEKV